MRYQELLSTAEVAFPATILADDAVAGWARDHRVAIDIRSRDELVAALEVGIRPALMTVFAESLDSDDLAAATALGVGRVVVDRAGQIAVLRGAVGDHTQRVVIRIADTDQSPDRMVAAMVGNCRLRLVGLQCEVGSRDGDFVSLPAAIGHLVAEMAHIRHRHGLLLTRLGIGGGPALLRDGEPDDLDRLAGDIDTALDDACATMRFPRPVVVLSLDGADVDRRAA